MAYLVEWLLAQLFKIKDWRIGNKNSILQQYATGDGKPLPPAIEKIVLQYLPIAIAMNDFFCNLKVNKATPYPTFELDKICRF